VINKQILVGNVGKDPQVKTFDNGDTVATVTLATSEKWTDKKSGEKKELTEWHTVIFRGKLAEVVQQYVKKGTQLYVEGTTKTRKYEKDGIEYRVKEVHSFVMQMLSKQSGDSNAPAAAQPSAAQPIDLPEDDIPF
tara:strand:- start:3549 stop:3956 length:408 start_codon:yes stop_codon:yes gene_type:complete